MTHPCISTNKTLCCNIETYDDAHVIMRWMCLCDAMQMHKCKPNTRSVTGTSPASVEYLLKSSRVFLHWSRCAIVLFPLTNRSPLAVFWLNPAENTDSPNSWNLLFKTPKSMLVIYFNHLCKVYWRFVMNVNYHQQTSSSESPSHTTRQTPI
jgi:hypothetical protein